MYFKAVMRLAAEKDPLNDGKDFFVLTKNKKTDRLQSDPTATTKSLTL